MARFDLRAWWPAGVWMALLFWASSRPGSALPTLSVWDKLVHVAVYAVLGVLTARGFSGRPGSGGSPRRAWAGLAGFVVAALYGVTDEYHQSFVPGRFGSGADVVANALGSAIGAAAHTWLRRLKEAR